MIGEKSMEVLFRRITRKIALLLVFSTVVLIFQLDGQERVYPGSKESTR